MKKGFMIVIISAALLMFSACTRQIQETVSGQSRNQITMELKQREYRESAEAETKNDAPAVQTAICGKLSKTGGDTCSFLIKAYADMFSYVADDRYLIAYRDSDVNQKCIYDLDTLKGGAFSEYVIRYYNSFLFTDHMKEIYLAEAMNDALFEDKPYYTYYDEEGNPKLEIYFDKNGAGCGICYDAYDDESSKEYKGFVFSTKEAAWKEENGVQWYEPEEYFKDVKRCKTGDYSEIRNYEEQYEYNDAGQVIGFYAKGETNLFTDEWLPVDIASYTCEYNDDGSKKKEKLSRHSLLFGTSDSTASCYYDEKGRIAYIRSYITHGSLENFFIYEDGGDIPAYRVVVDHNLDMDYGQVYRYAP